jgi:hypothetical protein
MASFGWTSSKSCKEAPKSRCDEGDDEKDGRPVSWHHKHSHHDGDKKRSSRDCG